MTLAIGLGMFRVSESGEVKEEASYWPTILLCKTTYWPRILLCITLISHSTWNINSPCSQPTLDLGLVSK